MNAIKSENTRYIEFFIGNEKFLLPLLTVREVISPPPTTPIPNGEHYFVGIMNLRGTVASIINLKEKLKIHSEHPTKEEAVIIVNFEGLEVGLLVDFVTKVHFLSEQNFIDHHKIKNMKNKELIIGSFKSDNDFLPLLNLSEVLNTKMIVTKQSRMKHE